MVEYVREIARALTTAATQRQNNVLEYVRELNQEIAELKPVDFVPVAQFPFVEARMELRRWAGCSNCDRGSLPGLAALASRIDGLLGFYGGPDATVAERNFTFLGDPELSLIIKRDYRELSLFLLPSGAHKSTVVLAGSILEAVLFDQIGKDAATIAAANNAIAAPKTPSGTRISFGEQWKLTDLIRVSEELGILPKDRARSIDQILRDYRNFVHPKKEIRAGHACNAAEALLAKGALDSVLDHLSLIILPK